MPVLADVEAGKVVVVDVPTVGEGCVGGGFSVGVSVTSCSVCCASEAPTPSSATSSRYAS